MLRPRGQPGLEAKIFGLGLVASGLGLVLGLMQCWPRSHEGWPRCQSPKARHLRYVDCSLTGNCEGVSIRVSRLRSLTSSLQYILP